MPSTDFTQVNANAMQTGITDLSAAYRQLTSLLNDLKGQLGTSLNEWDGEARRAYTRVQHDWDTSANHMSDIINKMTTVLSQISDGYDTNERQVQSSWS